MKNGDLSKYSKIVSTVGAITSFKATKASEFTIEFDKAQPETVTITITKSGAAVDGKLTWNEGRTSATFAGTANFANGEYTATVANGTENVTATATVEDEKVDEIVITSTTALTNDDATSAYIYYDVFNQYKESIRSSTSINWTVSSCDKYTVDKATGRISANKGKDDKAFTYGETIYVVGVNVKSGKSVTASVTVGMAQAIDTVEMVGFVNKNNKTKIEPSLPKNFAKDTYYLLYTAKDQNGNPLEAEEYDASKITFISDAPLLMESSIKEKGNIYSIDGTDYASVLVNPGNYVDKGGEVNITAVSNKTGKRTTKNFQVGANGILQSLVLNAPNGTIADGDGTLNGEAVKIPFVAKDTEGKTITNYDTIVRSSNAVTLNAGDNTTLEIVEENDGTAGIYWHDSIQANKFDNSSASDDIDRSILLSSIVVGGEANNVMLNVSDMRRPVAIKSIYFSEGNAIVSNDSKSINFYSDDNNNAPVRYIDQYGADLLPEKAAAFFGLATTKGFDGDKYAIAAKTTSADREKLFSGKSVNVNEQAIASGSAICSSNGELGFTSNLPANSTDRASVTVKYSIAVQENGKGDYSDASKVKTETYTVVDKSEIENNLTINVAGTKYGIMTSLSGEANGDNLGKDEYSNPVTACAVEGYENYSDEDGNLLIPEAAIVTAESWRRGQTWGDDTAFEIKGTTRDGITITVPAKEYKPSEASDIITVDPNNTTITNVVAGVKKDNLKWYELYNVNTAKNTRTVAAKTLVVDVYGVPVKARVQVSDEMIVPASIKFTQNWGILGTNTTIKPNNTKISKSSVVTNTTHPLNVIVYDQYGRAIDQNKYNFSVSYKVSDIKESTSDMTYMVNSFAVNQNNTENASISGAEIGDAYKLTATVDGYNISTSVDVTVGSDGLARISTNKNNNTDETFRKDVLGMNR